MGTYDPPQNCQKHAITYCNEEIWNEHLQSKHRNVDLKAQKMQKTINKSSIILEVADSLNKIKHNTDMTESDMKNAVMPLIQMCTDGLTFLAHGNNLLNQAPRNYITSVLSYLGTCLNLVKKYQRILIGSLETMLFPE